MSFTPKHHTHTNRPTTAPARRSRMARRLTTAALAASLTLPLTACSDGDFSLPSGDQLKEFVSDAQSQLDTIGSDVSELAGKLGDLPESVRGSAQVALDKSKDAADKAQSALNDAKDSKDGAEDALNNAQDDLVDAKDKVNKALSDLEGKSDSGSEETRKTLESLRGELDKLQSKVTSD